MLNQNWGNRFLQYEAEQGDALMMTQTEIYLSAEQYAYWEDERSLSELIRGQVVTFPFHMFSHGLVCSNIVYVFGCLHDEKRGQGFVGTGIITRRNPDTVRGADYSFKVGDKLPRVSHEDGWFEVAPEIIFEVLERWDTWADILCRVGEYLDLDAVVVNVVDPCQSKVYVFQNLHPVQILGPGDDWSAPEILPGFRVPVRKFFE